jgi:hypothetical protein
MRSRFEDDLEQGVGPLGDRMDASDGRVERLLCAVEFASLGLLDRVTEAVVGVLVAEVGQGENVQGGGEPVEGVDKPWVRAQVVSCPRPGRTGETQIGQPSGAEMTWTLPPWCLCF